MHRRVRLPLQATRFMINSSNTHKFNHHGVHITPRRCRHLDAPSSASVGFASVFFCLWLFVILGYAAVKCAVAVVSPVFTTTAPNKVAVVQLSVEDAQKFLRAKEDARRILSDYQATEYAKYRKTWSRASISRGSDEPRPLSDFEKEDLREDGGVEDGLIDE